MKNLLTIILALHFSIAFSQLITFDGLPGAGIIPNPHMGLNFSSVGNYQAGSGAGYLNNMVSPPNVAFNGFAVFPWDIISVGGPITFTSLSLGAAWNVGEVVQISPIGGAQAPINVTINCTGPAQNVVLNWANITGIRFSLINAGVSGGCGAGGGEHIVLDNLLINSIPPVPTLSEWGIIIFGLSLLALGTVYLRRKSILSVVKL
ncbi:MAG: IPTL-CTERM sorting domain-containing protein [Saprospiraceae bacterium]|nr:IPTL-CTERM sorting domain-containing protein [Saprospiraceae bacterium]HMW38579.1 IPTL-CTERM sorting domain-containing protein [Saprospiraceae bacterium]HMX88780.1 IPTL-CTERM sorting domain-containing protein [Saprospiraceae bacterium]HMZ40480.1 IPTL-CTERM sorting domain-containing protein [Saprospiraceae bacterium]HNA64740.1 IPTL-CTERM sorting domain-containing protein [Saprospiraceae bacterium]